jgi:hypothetical protein
MDFIARIDRYIVHILTNMAIARHRLKTGIMEPERMPIAEERFGNHVPAAKNSNERVHLLGNGSISTFP